MPRGGYRPGAGGQFKWKHGKTKTIRVPVAIADKVIEAAKEIDEGVVLSRKIRPQLRLYSEEHTTDESKTIDLSGISLCQHDGALAVRLEDLAKAGYSFKPHTVSEMIKARMRKLSGGKSIGGRAT